MSHQQVRGRADAIRLGLKFTFRHWAQHKGKVAVILAVMTLSTLSEALVPIFAGRLVDALPLGVAGRAQALWAFAAMVGLTLMPVLCVRSAIFVIIDLTLKSMQTASREAFHRVQRFSTDWHANAFSGSVVRKITRGVWAMDLLNDVLLLGIYPAIAVLTGTMILLTAHWPLLGFTMAAGSLAYIALAVTFAMRVVAPAASLSNQWDTRMGGMLADAIGANSVVKGFGAEAREDLRIGRVVGKWSRRTRRTWRRATWGSLSQTALLWVVRGCVTGGAVWLWWQGKASPGDVVYVLTTYLVIHGFLRDISQHVNNLQRSVNDMEELVKLHDEPLGIEDAADARRSASSWARSASLMSASAMARMRHRFTRIST